MTSQWADDAESKPDGLEHSEHGPWWSECLPNAGLLPDETQTGPSHTLSAGGRGD